MEQISNKQEKSILIQHILKEKMIHRKLIPEAHGWIRLRSVPPLIAGSSRVLEYYETGSTSLQMSRMRIGENPWEYTIKYHYGGQDSGARGRLLYEGTITDELSYFFIAREKGLPFFVNLPQKVDSHARENDPSQKKLESWTKEEIYQAMEEMKREVKPSWQFAFRAMYEALMEKLEATQKAGS